MDPRLHFIIKYAPLCAIAFVQLSGIGPIYQIIKIKKTSNVSAIPFVAMIVNCILWVYYAQLVEDSVMFIANLTGIICGALYFGLYCMYTSAVSRKAETNRLAFLLSVVFGFLIPFPWIFGISPQEFKNLVAFVGCITAFFLMSSPLASMKKVIAAKNTSSMSLIMSIAMTTNGLTWAIYGYLIRNGDKFIVVPNAAGAVAGFVQLSLFCIYPSGQAYQTVPV